MATFGLVYSEEVKEAVKSCDNGRVCFGYNGTITEQDCGRKVPALY